MTITRAQALVLLEPKYSTIWHEAWPKQAVEYTAYTNQRTSKKATTTDFNMTDFGSMVLKPEGTAITADDPIFGNQKAYTAVRFALKYGITQEMLDHELYGQVTRLESALIDSANDHQEVTAALIFNSGFGTTDADGFTAAGFDGLALFSTAHTRLDGLGTIRNRPSTDVDLSVTGLTQALIDFDNLVNDRGRPQKIRPVKLLINPEDRFTAKEILESEYKPGVANNEINAIRSEGLSFMVSHYLTDNDAWFLVGDKHDLNFIWDEKPRPGTWDDPDKEVIYHKVVQGYVAGHGEWRGTWGTTGA